MVKLWHLMQQTLSSTNTYRGSQGLDPDIIKEIEKMYGMDKPAIERFFKMLKDYLTFNFGESFLEIKRLLI